MEQKTKALKTSSRIIAILMKIGYVATIVAMCICAATLIFMAVTGGRTSVATAGGIHIRIADGLSVAPKELAATCAAYLVMGSLLFVVFLLASRMFGEISKTGDPFVEKYGETVRTIGILAAIIPIAAGIVDSVASLFGATEGLEAYAGFPGIAVGAILFCLSYILDYGCALQSQRKE